MVGNVASSSVSALSRWRLTETRPEDAAGIARLLAEPSSGAVRMAVVPLDDAPDEPEVRRHAVVARGADGAVAGHGARTVRRLWLSGAPRRIGYLHGLRRDPTLAGAGRALACGLTHLAMTRQEDEIGHDLTAVLAANARARRVLERLPGAPCYHPLGGYRTLVLRVATAARWRPAADYAATECAPGDAAEVQTLIDGSAGDYAPVVDVAATLSDWCIVRRAGRIVGAIRVWDRRAHRRTLIAAYAPSLAVLRPLANAVYRALGRPGLPPAPADVALVHAAHATSIDADPAVFRALLGAAARAAADRGANVLSLGFGEDHPLLGLAARLPAWRLDSRLYAVGEPPDRRRHLAPEAALL